MTTMTTAMPAATTDLQARYNEDGYVVARNVLDAALIEEGRRHIEWLLAKNPDLRPEMLNTNLMSDDPFWVRLVGDERLLDIAEQFIGPNIALFASHYIAKPPLDGQVVLWHQDGSYWPLDPMQVVTLWLALDDTTPENGCLRVIPRTHVGNLQEMQQNTEVESVLGSQIDPQFVDESQAVDLLLKAGDVSIHHPNLIHGSNANTSPNWRRGLTIRYIPTNTHITVEPWPSAFLLRGHAVPGINDYLPKPQYVEGKHMPFRGCEN